MMDKKILRQAAAEADSALMKGLPEAADCPADFSPEFEQKLSRRLAAEKPFYGAVKRAACILLVFVLAGGSLLTASPTVRAAALGWLRESYGTVSVYRFQGKTPGGKLGTYRLLEVPEGYTVWSESQSAYDGHITYVNEEELFLTLGYMIQPSNGASALSVDQMEHLSVHDVIVCGVSGDFYLCEDGITSNSVIWVNEESGILFHLAGWLSEQELIDLANCINLVK